MDSRLKAADLMVRTQVMYVRSTDEFCNGCYWEGVLKPLISTVVGWGRVTDDPADVWLCTSEAYDLVTDVWLQLLYDADPGNGHGFRRG